MNRMRKCDCSVHRRALLAWNAVVVEELTRKQTVADDMHSYLLVRRYFSSWKKVRLLLIVTVIWSFSQNVAFNTSRTWIIGNFHSLKMSLKL